MSKLISNHDSNKDLLTYSDVESKRFGMRVFRGMMDEIDSDQILSTLIEYEVDLAILRIPASRQYQIPLLGEKGIPYIIADTLVYYAVDLTKYIPKPIKNRDLVFKKCSYEDIDTIKALVEVIFSSYTNHYTSNPYLKRKDILNGYKEWACNYVLEDDLHQTVWLASNNDMGNVGFATCNCNEGVGEGVLNGVLPTAARHGIYTDIIRFYQDYIKNAGCSRMIIATQIQNIVVQRVWNREGFELDQAYITVHINRFLRRSQK